MKGITPVIATILLLLITISMVGFAYMWFSNILTGVGSSAVNATESQINRMGQTIDIDSPKSGAIAVRNIGTKNIPSTSIVVYVNGVLVNCNWDLGYVAPNGVITADCNCVDDDRIKVSAPGNADYDMCIP